MLFGRAKRLAHLVEQLVDVVNELRRRDTAQRAELAQLRRSLLFARAQRDTLLQVLRRMIGRYDRFSEEAMWLAEDAIDQVDPYRTTERRE